MAKDPVVKHVITELEGAARVAWGWAAGPPGWVISAPGDDPEDARGNSTQDLNAAKKCKTVADLLACDRPAVRLAAQMALKGPDRAVRKARVGE